MKRRMIECPACALQSEAGPGECPYCGYEFPRNKQGVSTMAFVFALLMLIPLLWLVFTLFW